MALKRNAKRGAKGGAHFAGPGQAGSARRAVAPAQQGSGDFRPPVGPDPLESEAPRPIGVDPAATGSFEKLDAGEGAILTTRDNADDAVGAARERLSGTTGMMRLDASDLPPVEEHKPETHASKRVVVLLVVLTLAVILGGVYVFSRLTAGPERQASQEQAEQLQVSTTDTIEYHGTTYTLQQGDDGTWHLMRQSQDEGAEAQGVGDLTGTPVTMVLYNGAIVIPENKSDGTWDVVAYMLGSGWSQLVDSDGNAYGGQGSVSDATLDGSQLTVATDGGSTTIPLDW